jgi:protein O-mannosyl-transferase
MKSIKSREKTRTAGLKRNKSHFHRWNYLKRFFRWELLIILAGLVCDVNSWGHQFVYDDIRYIVENKFIQTPQNFFQIFASPLGPPELHLYRPLTALSLGLNLWLHGLNPDGFHLANRILHVMICLVIFRVLRYLLSSTVAASLTALLFAVHPVQTEAVTCIAGRSEVLTGLFFVLAWLFHIRARESGAVKGKIFAAALVFYLFSMMSKESGITLIAVILLTEYIYYAKRSPTSLYQNLRKGLWKVFAGYLAAAALFLGLRAIVLGKMLHAPTAFVDNPLFHASLLTRELTAMKILFQSLGLLLWPIHLSADYSYNQISLITKWSEPAGIAVTIACLVFLIILGWSYYRAQNVFLSLGYFLVTYSIVSNLIIPIGTIRADRLLYMPSLGIFLLIGILLAKLDVKIQWPWAKSAFYSAVAVLLILLGVRTVYRNDDWRDAVTLWEKTIQTSPNSTRARYSLGNAYMTEKKYGLAAEQYRIAESIYAKNSELLANLGSALYQMGDTEEAIRYYRRAIELAPMYPMIRYSLIVALRARGDLAEARIQEENIIAYYDDLIRKEPLNADHHFFKANALFHLERYRQALIEYKRTAQIDPNYPLANESINLAMRKLNAAK